MVNLVPLINKGLEIARSPANLSLHGEYISELMNRARELGQRSAIELLKNELCRHDIPCVFDVGANSGGYISELESIPNIEIHAFEPAPDPFSKLIAAYGHKANWRLNQTGLASKEGHSKFFLASDNGSNSLSPFSNTSLFAKGVSLKNTDVIKIKLETIDRYCHLQSVNRIHLLKLDVQSRETDVLRGARDLLASGRIDWIQTEIIFRDFYVGDPASFFWIESVLHPFGYTLVSIFDIYPSEGGKLFQCDAIYARREITKRLFSSQLERQVSPAKNLHRDEAYFVLSEQKQSVTEDCRTEDSLINGMLAYPDSPTLPLRLQRRNVLNAVGVLRDLFSKPSLESQRTKELTSILNYCREAERIGGHQDALVIYTTLHNLGIRVDSLMAMCKYWLHDYSGALTHFRSAIRDLNERQPAVLTFYGVALAAVGGTQEDIDLLATAAGENAPHAHAAITALAELFGRLGHQELATSLLAKIPSSVHTRYFVISSLFSLTKVFAEPHLDSLDADNASSNGGSARFAPAPQKRFLCSSLVTYGRFGHSLNDYLFLQLLAEQHGRTLCTPDWVGRRVFALKNPVCSQPFVRKQLTGLEIKSEIEILGPQILDGCDFFSPGELPDWNATTYSRCRELLTLRPDVELWCKSNLESMKFFDSQYLAIHIRLSDQLLRTDLIAAKEYANHIDNFLRGNPTARIYLMSDNIIEAAKYLEIENFDSVLKIPNINPSIHWLIDFYVLSQCQLGLLSQSSFSYWAAILNRNKTASFYQPDPAQNLLVPFNPTVYDTTRLLLTERT